MGNPMKRKPAPAEPTPAGPTTLWGFLALLFQSQPWLAPAIVALAVCILVLVVRCDVQLPFLRCGEGSPEAKPKQADQVDRKAANAPFDRQTANALLRQRVVAGGAEKLRSALLNQLLAATEDVGANHLCQELPPPGPWEYRFEEATPQSGKAKHRCVTSCSNDAECHDRFAQLVLAANRWSRLSNGNLPALEFFWNVDGSTSKASATIYAAPRGAKTVELRIEVEVDLAKRTQL